MTRAGALLTWHPSKVHKLGSHRSDRKHIPAGQRVEDGTAARARPMLHQLHLLRAIAVLLVVLDHTCLAISERMVVHPLCIELAWLAGFLGVAMFFTISGYIMVETTRTQPPRKRVVRQFLVRRLMRIVPMYYLATGLCIVAALAHLSNSASALDPVAILCSLLFIPVATADHGVEPVLTQGWTLDNEMAFYVLFGASLLLPVRIRAASLASLLIGLVAGAALLGRIGYDIGATARFLAAPIILNFVSGLMLASYGRSVVGRGSPWRPALLVIILVAGLCCAFAAAWQMSPDHVVLFGWWLHAAVLAVTTCSCWLCTRSNTPFPTRGLGGIVAWFCVLLANASYAIYLFHLFVITVVVRVAIFAGIGPVGTGFCCVILATAITMLVHCHVEQPVNGWLHRLSLRRRGDQIGEMRDAS